MSASNEENTTVPATATVEEFGFGSGVDRWVTLLLKVQQPTLRFRQGPPLSAYELRLRVSAGDAAHGIGALSFLSPHEEGDDQRIAEAGKLEANAHVPADKFDALWALVTLPNAGLFAIEAFLEAGPFIRRNQGWWEWDVTERRDLLVTGVDFRFKRARIGG